MINTKYRLFRNMDGSYVLQENNGFCEKWDDTQIVKHAPLTKGQLEIAARKYCELTGQDPELMVPYNDPAADMGNGVRSLALVKKALYRILMERFARMQQKDTDFINQAFDYARNS
jgi:hypothetical protein